MTPPLQTSSNMDQDDEQTQYFQMKVWLEKVDTGHFWEMGVLHVDEQEEGEDDVQEVWGLLVERGLHEFVKKLRILEEAIQE